MTRTLLSILSVLFLMTGCQSVSSLFSSAPTIERIPAYGHEHAHAATDRWEESFASTAVKTKPESAIQNSAEGSTPAAWLNRGHRARQTGDLDEAKKAYWQVLQQEPDHPLAHHRLAIIADKKNDFRTAEFHYQSALRANGSDPDLLSDVGYSYLLQKRYSESERLLRQAIERHPNHHHALNNLGLLFGLQGNYDSALAMFRRSNSEHDAQAKLARLFPQGPPQGGSNRSQLASNVNFTQPLHAPQPMAPLTPSRPSPDAMSPTQQTTVANGQINPQNRPNEITRRLKAEMDRARLQSRSQKRVGPSVNSQQPMTYASNNPQSSPPANNAYQATSYTQPRAGTNYPDNQLNRLMSQIDGHATGLSNHAATQPPAVTPQPDYAAIAGQKKQHSVGRSVKPLPLSPVGTDQPQQMPLWPPSASNQPFEDTNSSSDLSMNSNRQQVNRYSTNHSHAPSATVSSRHASPAAVSNGYQPGLNERANPRVGGASPTTQSHSGVPGAIETRRPYVDETRRTAMQMGMSTGPGGMFPALGGSSGTTQTTSQHTSPHNTNPSRIHPTDVTATSPYHASPNQATSGYPVQAYDTQRRIQEAELHALRQKLQSEQHHYPQDYDNTWKSQTSHQTAVASRPPHQQAQTSVPLSNHSAVQPPAYQQQLSNAATHRSLQSGRASRSASGYPTTTELQQQTPAQNKPPQWPATMPWPSY